MDYRHEYKGAYFRENIPMSSKGAMSLGTEGPGQDG